METVAKMLMNAGWEYDGTFSPQGANKGDPPRRVLTLGQRRAYIGPKYATFYIKHDNGIDTINTVQLDDTASIAHLARHPEKISLTPVG